MKKMKFAAALVAIAAMAVSVTGCGAKFDAKTYVQGSMDAQFKNEISDDFAKITEGGKEAIQAQYDENIEELNTMFIEMGCPEDMAAEFKTATQDLLKACKYTVGDAVQGEDKNYTVPVTVEPIQFMTDEMQTEMQEHLMAKVVELGEAADEETIMNETFAFMLEKFKEAAANPVYGEAQTIDVRVEEVSKNLYDIPAEDQDKLSNAVFGM